MSRIDSLISKEDTLGKKELIERLHLIFSESEKEERLKILQELNRLGDDGHYTKVESYFISSEDPEIRMEAAKLLAFNYDKRKAIKPLIWLLQEGNSTESKLSVIRLLTALSYKGEFKDAIIENLLNLMNDNSERIISEVIESLALINENKTEDRLIEFLKSKNPSIRIKTIKTLGKLKISKIVPYLVNHLEIESQDEWHFTFNALKNILNNKLGVLLRNYLNELLKEEQNESKSSLIKGLVKALGLLKDTESVPMLIKITKHKYYWVRNEAEQALNNIQPDWKKIYKIC